MVTASRTLISPFLEKIGAFLELCFGIQGVWNKDAEFNGTTFRERITKERYTVVDSYDVGYDLTTSPASPPPYEGNYFGPGPLIPNQPDRERRVTSRMIWDAENRINMDVESDFYGFWFGPRISFQPNEYINLYCNPNVSIHYVTMDIDRTEQFVAIYSGGQTETLNSWQDNVSEDEWAFGVGVQAGVEVNIKDGWFVGAFGGYDWVDEAEVDIDPNTVTFDPSGYTVGLEFGKKL